ncbi:MAG TPA: hypothetical protein VEA44_17080 [Caulobacter sp.]|nr:hypothetical protein [Caulobacter sp.]
MESGSPPPALPESEMVTAAKRLVSDMFRQVALQMPELVKLQGGPTDSPIPKFTDDMLVQLQLQLDRALGLPARTPSDGARPSDRNEPPP